MEEILSHLEQIKENIFKNNQDFKEQSKYFKNNKFNVDNDNKNKRFINSNQKTLILSRPSIINITKNIKSIDMTNKFYLLEESSDNEDGYNEDIKHTIPSLMKVEKNIFDPNTIMILTDIKYFPRESQPGLIITGIEDWVTEKHLKYFLKGVPSFREKYKSDKNNNYNKNNETIDLDINSIKFFTEQNKRYAFIKLNNYNQMEIIGNYFLNPIKKMYPSYNSKKEKIEVYFAYDLLKLTKNHWYGVILRNLPPNCTDKSIYNFTEQTVSNGIKYCLNPITIDNIYCSLVVCKELEQAEKLCQSLNNKNINNDIYLKAHLHPKICKIRNEKFITNSEMFSNEGYLFNVNAEQSEKCLEFAKPFMEFFYPDYLSSFNHNKSKKKEKDLKNLNDNNENSKKNKEKEKNLKKEKDLTLASSILDLLKHSKSNEEFKKNNNQNLIEKPFINNNKNEQSVSNNKNEEIQNNEQSINKINIKSTIIKEQNSQTNLNINKINSQNLSLNTIENINESKTSFDNIIHPEENKEKSKDETQNLISNENNNLKYTQDEINYYTYNMGDQKFYEELENQYQRKTSSYQQRNSNNDYKDYYKSNNYNRDYKSQRYDHNKNNNQSPYKKYNQSYSKQNITHQKSNKDRDYNINKNRYYNNYKEKSREKSCERSRDKNDSDEWKNFRDSKDKKYYDYDNRKDREWDRNKDNTKGWNRDKDRERNYDKDKERNKNRDRDREWEKDKERNRDRDKEREKNRERYSDDRNRRNNDFRYYERNNNYNHNERRKESWHQSNSWQKNDRDKKEKHFNDK